MDSDLWNLTPLVGLALVFAANLLRFRRTEDRGCLGHLFVATETLTRSEWALSRVASPPSPSGSSLLSPCDPITT